MLHGKTTLIFVLLGLPIKAYYFISWKGLDGLKCKPKK